VEEHTQSLTDALPQAYPVIGWVVGLVMAVWSYLLKVAIGEHIEERKKINATLGSIDVRLSRIEGRFDERDHGGGK